MDNTLLGIFIDIIYVYKFSWALNASCNNLMVVLI